MRYPPLTSWYLLLAEQGVSEGDLAPGPKFIPIASKAWTIMAFDPRTDDLPLPASGGDMGFDVERFNSTAENKRPLLLRGATIITMDSNVGDFARGDLLIEGATIAP